MDLHALEKCGIIDRGLCLSIGKEVHGLIAKWNDISNISCTRRLTDPKDGSSPQPTTIVDARIKNIPYKYIVGKKLLFGMNELDITKVKEDPFSERQFVQRLYNVIIVVNWSYMASM